MTKITAMSRSIVLGLAVLGLPFGAIGAANAAPAKGGWVKVATEPQAKLDFYVDRGTLQSQSGFSYFWLYSNSSVGRPLGKVRNSQVYGVAFYVSADCRQANLRLRSVELIDQQGKQVSVDNPGDAGPLGQFNQRSAVGRSLLKYVCNR